MKLVAVGAELHRTDKEADGRTDILKPTVTFLNSANAPQTFICAVLE